MNIDLVSITHCAQVISGYSAKGAIADDPNGRVQVITAQHLTKGEPYNYRPAHRLRITPPRDSDKYNLEPGDILFMSRGSNNYAVLLENIPQPAIAPLTFFILKPKTGVVPAYLAWCLNQEPVKAQINAIRTGAGTPMIPRKAFSEITIPLPSLDKQLSLAALADLQARETALLQQLVQETERMHRLTGQRVLINLTGAIER